MNKTETYTPSNFRKNSYNLFHQVSKDKKIVQITMSNGKEEPNSNDLIISKKQYLNIVNKSKSLKKKELANQLDKITSQLSNNKVPVFTKPKQYEKWCEEHHD